jgi:MOSC domain-containing protein YiiM
MRMGDASFVERFALAGRPGTYCAIEEPGSLGPGDGIERLEHPHHGVTIGMVAQAYHRDDDLLRLLPDLEDLSDAWRKWADHRLTGRRQLGD